MLRSIHTSAQRSTTAAMAALVTDDVAEAGIAKAMAKLQTEDEPGDWTEGMDASQLERAKASLRWAPGYYERVEAGARSTCVKPSALHGAGLFATRAFRRGDVVLRERPLVAMQDLANKREVVACGNCLKFIDLGKELLRLVKDEEDGRRCAHDAVCQVPRGGPEGVCCHAQCGELYCSTRCRDEHVRRGHGCLCVGHITEQTASTDPLFQYKVLAAQSNEILLLAAEVAVLWLGRGDEAFTSFVREPWDAVITKAASLRGEADAGELAASLRALGGDAAPLLRAALTPHFGERASIVDADWLARIIGTFEQNNIGIRRGHPLDGADKDDWPPLEGTALYSAACRANHACAPSCDVVYEDGGPLRVALVAARDIREGEELTISYVDSDQDAVDRRAATADYGFLCECPRCAGVD